MRARRERGKNRGNHKWPARTSACLQTTWKKTVAFYEGLGFSVALRTVNEAAGEQVAFLQLKELMIEAYQTGRAAGRAGAVDHIALDVADVDTLFVLLRDGGYELLDDAVRFLPFWARGVRFFTILGPNGEKVEFSQKL